MTNEMMILMERVRLLNDGIIGSTGRQFTFKDSNGELKTIEEPEEIHTFQYWKSMGLVVRKGEKAVTSLVIWKHTPKKERDDGTEVDEKMFMKKASFFTRGQVEKPTTKVVVA